MILEYIKKHKWAFGLAIIFLFLFLYAMVWVPFETGAWSNAQKVWHNWQSFNAAMIALFSGLIFFMTSRYSEYKKHYNKARAARAFLSHQLSHISRCCDSNIKLLIPLMNHLEREETTHPSNGAYPIFSYVPFGADYFPFFKDSIELEGPDLGSALSEILSDIQVNESRLYSLTLDMQPDDSNTIISITIHHKIFEIAEVKAKASKLFNYARGDKKVFAKSTLTKEEVASAINTADNFLLLDQPGLLKEFNHYYSEIT